MALSVGIFVAHTLETFRSWNPRRSPPYRYFWHCRARL